MIDLVWHIYELSSLDLGIDFEDEEDVPFQPSSPPDPPHHLTLDEPQLMHTVRSGTLADQGESMPELITEKLGTAFEEQQRLRLPDTYLEGSDGYVDVVADDAEPMAMTRGMVIMMISCREMERQNDALDDIVHMMKWTITVTDRRMWTPIFFSMVDHPDVSIHFFPEMTPEELEDDELIIDESLTPIERMSMFVKSNEVVHR